MIATSHLTTAYDLFHFLIRCLSVMLIMQATWPSVQLHPEGVGLVLQRWDRNIS